MLFHFYNMGHFPTLKSKRRKRLAEARHRRRAFGNKNEILDSITASYDSGPNQGQSEATDGGLTNDPPTQEANQQPHTPINQSHLDDSDSENFTDADEDNKKLAFIIISKMMFD